MELNKYSRLTEELSGLGIVISEDKVRQFDRYYELLIEWNQKMNLTAITEFDEVLIKHFADSASLSRMLDVTSVDSMIDVGTGAGFPGIPLKILFPHLKLTLLDSLNKRITFLGEVVDQLGLSNVTLVHGRAEDVSREKEHRAQYDVCVSRAVANLSTLTELCIPFVKTGGAFVPYKSEKTEEEVAAAKNAFFLLGCKCEKTESFQIDDNYRTLLLIRKVSNTSNTYPRKAGTPAKKPL